MEYDEPFEGFGPLMAKDRARDPNRVFKNDDVIDFTRTKKLKEMRTEMFGDSRVIPVPVRPLTKAEIAERLNAKRIAGPDWEH
jgi:hypothetical protein